MALTRPYLKLLLLLIMQSTLRMTEAGFKNHHKKKPTARPALGPLTLRCFDGSRVVSARQWWEAVKLQVAQTRTGNMQHYHKCSLAPLKNCVFSQNQRQFKVKAKKKRAMSHFTFELCFPLFFYLTRLTAACNSPRKKKKKHEKKGK